MARDVVITAQTHKAHADAMQKYAGKLGVSFKRTQVLNALGALHGTSWEQLQARPEMPPVRREKRVGVLYDALKLPHDETGFHLAVGLAVRAVTHDAPRGLGLLNWGEETFHVWKGKVTRITQEEGWGDNLCDLYRPLWDEYSGQGGATLIDIRGLMADEATHLPVQVPQEVACTDSLKVYQQALDYLDALEDGEEATDELLNFDADEWTETTVARRQISLVQHALLRVPRILERHDLPEYDEDTGQAVHVPGPAVTAHAMCEMSFYDIHFNGAAWLQNSDEEEICKFARLGWEDTVYRAFARNRPTPGYPLRQVLEQMLDYHRRSFHVYIDEDEAHAWLAQHRPDVLKAVEKAEKWRGNTGQTEPPPPGHDEDFNDEENFDDMD